MVEENQHSKTSAAEFNVIFFKQPTKLFFNSVVLVCSALLLKLLGISFSKVLSIGECQGTSRLTPSDCIRI